MVTEPSLPGKIVVMGEFTIAGREQTLADKLEKVLNGYENDSNTPDFILAQFLTDVLLAWNAAVRGRAAWYGRMDVPAQGSVPFPDAETMKKYDPYPSGQPDPSDTPG